MPSNIDIPTVEEPIARDGDDAERRRMTYIWWRFFQNLANRMANTVPYSAQTGIVAAGTTQLTATDLDTEWNVVSTVLANTGVIITPFGAGTTVTVFNSGANTLKVYPPVGYTMGGVLNAAYALAAGKSQTFYQTDDTSFLSTQLG